MNHNSKTWYVYRFENTITKSSYVGKTRDVFKRWNKHIKTSQKNPHYKLHRALAKYGIQSFGFEVLERDIANDAINDREKFWIAHFNSFYNGYNMTLGGDGGTTFLGRNHSDETKRKISVGRLQENRTQEWRDNHKHAQQNRSAEWRKNISEAQKNKPPPSDETRQRMRSAWVKRKAEGRVISAEGRAKISVALKGRKSTKHFCDTASDHRKLALLKQDVDVVRGLKTLSDRAMKRHIKRITECYWRTYTFNNQVVEQVAKDLRLRLDQLLKDQSRQCEDQK